MGTRRSRAREFALTAVAPAAISDAEGRKPVSATRRTSTRVCGASVMSGTLCSLAYRTPTRPSLVFPALIFVHLWPPATLRKNARTPCFRSCRTDVAASSGLRTTAIRIPGFVSSRGAAGAPRRTTAHAVVGRFFDFERAVAVRRLVYLLFDYCNSTYHFHTWVGPRTHDTTLRMFSLVLCDRRIAGCMRAREWCG